MEGDDRHGQAINDADPLLRHIQHLQDRAPHEVAERQEVAAAPVEATLRGQGGNRSRWADQKLSSSVSMSCPRHSPIIAIASNSLSLQVVGAGPGRVKQARTCWQMSSTM
jgi:hypothetical protein